MRQLNRKSNQFGIDLTPQTPQSTGLERINDQLSNPINPQGGAISSIGNMLGGSRRQKQINDFSKASGSQAYDQATGLGAINSGPIDQVGTFSRGMMMKSPLKEKQQLGSYESPDQVVAPDGGELGASLVEAGSNIATAAITKDKDEDKTRKKVKTINAPSATSYDKSKGYGLIQMMNRMMNREEKNTLAKAIPKATIK